MPIYLLFSILCHLATGTQFSGEWKPTTAYLIGDLVVHSLAHKNAENNRLVRLLNDKNVQMVCFFFY